MKPTTRTTGRRLAGPLIPASMGQAVRLLLDAYECAEALGRPARDFALPMAELKNAGLGADDLRWLVARKYADSAVEVRRRGQARRSYRRGKPRAVTPRTCVVLTAAGAAAARRLGGGRKAVRRSEACRPRWDAAGRRLLLGRVVLKQFRRRAPTQETILNAFEEEGWPERVDDPLPGAPGQDPKQHLFDTLKNLNRGHRCRVLRFLPDGTGDGVRWEYL